MNWYNIEYWDKEYYYTETECKLSYLYLFDDGIRSYCNDSLVDTYQVAIL